MRLAALLLPIALFGGAETPASLASRAASARGAQRVSLLVQLSEAERGLDADAAFRHAEEALTLAAQIGDGGGLARAHVARAAALVRQAHYDAARGDLDAAERLFTPRGDQAGLASVLHNRGNVEFSLRRMPEALDLFTRALALRRSLGDERATAETLNNLGNVQAFQQQHQKAIESWQEALVLARRVGDEPGVARELNNLGIMRRRAGDVAGALALYLESLRIEERIGNLQGVVRTLDNIGGIDLDLGRLGEADSVLSRGLATAERIGDRAAVATALGQLGRLAAARGDFEAAFERLSRSLTLAEAIGDPRLIGQALDAFGQAHERRGDRRAALRDYERWLRTSQNPALLKEQCDALHKIGKMHLALGEPAAAMAALQRSLALSTTIGHHVSQRDLQQTVADAYLAQGRYREAFLHLREYARLREETSSEAANVRMAELQARYSVERKEQEIAALRRDNEIQKLSLRAARLRVEGLVAFVALGGVLLALLLRRYRHLLAFWKRRAYVGPYRLLERLGSGGMADVYAAVHIHDRTRRAAVKLLREQYSDDPALRQRFKNEAVLIDQLHHPHIVQVFERGDSSDRLYIAMELIEGRSLADVVAAGARLPLAECLEIVRQLADALAKIHAKGIVHRDVKPENVMLDERAPVRPFAKLLDFDIAKSHSLTRLTETGMILGTVAYLAPEQIVRQESSPASDVYALGVVFYQLLTLETPFLGENAAQVVRLILDSVPLAPVTLRPDVPPAVDALVLDMLAKDPRRRPDDEALRARLEELVAARTAAPFA